MCCARGRSLTSAHFVITTSIPMTYLYNPSNSSIMFSSATLVSNTWLPVYSTLPWKALLHFEFEILIVRLRSTEIPLLGRGYRYTCHQGKSCFIRVIDAAAWYALVGPYQCHHYAPLLLILEKILRNIKAWYRFFNVQWSCRGWHRNKLFKIKILIIRLRSTGNPSNF